MTKKQKEQFNQMRAALIVISKEYETPVQLCKSSKKKYGLSYLETIEMAYENIQDTAKQAVKGIKAITDEKE